MMPSLADLEQRLRADRDRLRAEIADQAAVPAELADSEESYPGNHFADAATDVFEEERAQTLEAHLKGLLEQVDAALERIGHGTYGICENCGQPIGQERLDALPYATTCIRCAKGRDQSRVARQS